MSREYHRRTSILGIVPTHGPFVVFDDFESILKWSKYSGVGDSIFELDPTTAYAGNQSLHMKTRTTDAAEFDKIGARGYFYLSDTKKLDMSVHLKSPDWTKIHLLSFYFNFFDATHSHYVALDYRHDIPIWKYRDSGGLMANIPNSDFTPLALAWHRLRLQANLNTNKYTAMIFDNLTFDLSALSYDYNTDTNPINFNIAIIITSALAEPCELHIDDFLLHEI